ncbi:MAG: alpha/beta hydrolase, partial [Gammaproteobacteria bacterium]|nr:alpha/beta hydrolase [Gammaproteobacteria bacterium]
MSLLFLIGALPMIAQAESRYFTTSDGVKLHYTVTGEGPPMVFVPGWTMPAWIFASQIEYFSDTHRVIAFDPRSQGESAIAKTGHEPRRRARDIAELIKKEKLKDVMLVGWSLGVIDSLAYTHYHGSRDLAALVLI